MIAIILSVALLGLEDGPNPVYREIESGITIDGTKVNLPAPSLSDRETAESEAKAVSTIAGSEKARVEFLRDSVSAPLILKTRDEKTASGAFIRHADLWFVIRAEHDALDPSKVIGDAAEGQVVEAGNMKFKSTGVSAEALAKLGIKAKKASDEEHFVHQSSRLLDRLLVDSTDRVTSTMTEHSTLVASRTDPRFDASHDYPNHWSTVERKQGKEVVGKPEPYFGSLSYVKATKLKSTPGALLVEVHLAYHEPKAWFDGAPILKSKIGVVAQDRIRSLRRELAKSRSSKEPRTLPKP